MHKLIVLAIAITVGSVSYAQDDHWAGAKLGYNHLLLNYDNLIGDDNTTRELNGGGFQLGGWYSYTPFDNFFLQAELLFSNRMWNESTVEVNEGQVITTNEVYTHYSNNYFQIPLIGKYGLNLQKRRYGGAKYLFFYGGVATHLLLTTKGTQQQTMRIETQDQVTVTQEEITFDKAQLKEHFTPAQVSATAGIQYNFEFGLNVDFRYQYLMTPVTQVSEDFGVLKQGIVSISIGYNFLSDY